MESLIRLFKAVPIDKHIDGKKASINEEILEETIERGFVFSPDVYGNYTIGELRSIIKDVSSTLGLTKEQMNATFHKSWNKVATASLFQLVVEQIFHYITTYGYESLGIYDQNNVYIPVEALDIPKVDVKEISLTLIKGYTKDEIAKKMLELLASGIALSKQTIDDVITVSNTFGVLTKENVESIKNREVKIIVSDQLGLVPSDPVEFLRMCVYKRIGKTLLIKDKETIEALKISPVDLYPLMCKYIQQEYTLRKQRLIVLSSIFYRFKPLFLAFKTNPDPRIRHLINRLRKLAKLHNVNAPISPLDTITSLVKNGKPWQAVLERALPTANVFRKVRLAQALRYRLMKPTSMLYKIRNGKAYATDYAKNFAFFVSAAYDSALKMVLDSIASDIKTNVNGKKIYIPNNIVYTVPATEKQMVGNLPSMSYVEAPTGITVGVNWNNVSRNRIDLDLSLQSLDGVKIGWNAFYRSSDRKVLFSGDMTDASGKNGASEAFFIKSGSPCSFALGLNYFNFSDYNKIEVPFKLFVSKQKVLEESRNFVVNPNNMIAEIGCSINVKQKILGLIVQEEDRCRFYITSFEMGNARALKNTEYVKNATKSLIHSCENQITLAEVLQNAGAILVDTSEGCDIDLSLEKLEKDTIINLLKHNSVVA